MTEMKTLTRTVAVCGVSNRALKLFIGPLSKRQQGAVQLAALLDTDPLRFEVCKRQHPEYAAIPCYPARDFDAMLSQVMPHALFVSGTDHTHIDYILGGLNAGLDVIVEKPMVTTWPDCLRVLEAERNSTGKVYVAFNFRYAPLHKAIRELIAQKRLGKIVQVNMEYYLDPFHGASYFKRWHRKRLNSGGLAIHKACHHFDLINWWIGQTPKTVSAFGSLNYFGPQSEFKPSFHKTGMHCSDCGIRPSCDYDQYFQKHLNASVLDGYTGVRNGHEYGSYRPDACIFDPEIDIEDVYVANVQYSEGALLSYALNFSAPFEGYRLSINGTRARLETRVFLHSQRLDPDLPREQTICVYDLFGGVEKIDIPVEHHGHLGGDAGLLSDLLSAHLNTGPGSILAGAREGALSVAVGDAINRSISEQRVITIPEF